MALPKSFRLPRIDLLIARKKGKSYSGKLYSVIFYKRPAGSDSANRFAVVISARVDKKAVVRNWLKRIICSHLPDLPAKSYDLIIFPKKIVLNLPHEEINSGFDSFLSEIYSQNP